MITLKTNNLNDKNIALKKMNSWADCLVVWREDWFGFYLFYWEILFKTGRAVFRKLLKSLRVETCQTSPPLTCAAEGYSRASRMWFFKGEADSCALRWSRFDSSFLSECSWSSECRLCSGTLLISRRRNCRHFPLMIWSVSAQRRFLWIILTHFSEEVVAQQELTVWYDDEPEDSF